MRRSNQAVALHVIEERELEEGIWLVRGGADVGPTMEWLAANLLVGALRGRVRSDALRHHDRYKRKRDQALTTKGSSG